ncbi:MAG: RNA methyltransferase, partial [Caldisericaceae bacterium]
GEKISLFDEKHIYEGFLEEITKNNLLIKIDNIKDIEKRKFNFEIIQAVIDKNELELAIRLLISAYVKKIYLFKSERSNIDIKEKYLERLSEIAINTAEQSEVCFVPQISYFENLENLPKEIITNSILLHPKGENTLINLQQIVSINQPVRFFIGPEGGFSNVELNYFKEQGIHFVKLTSGIVRSQFAGVVAVLTALELMT